MEVILKKDVEKLGFEGDLVVVKPGYARNFLIPQGYAVTANQANKNARDQKLKRLELKKEAMRDQYIEILSKLKDQTVTVGAKVGESEKIFGSVTTIQISEAIKADLGVELDRRTIKLESDIKTLGTYEFKVELGTDLIADMEVEVKAE